MIELFLPRSATRVVVYLEPIDVRWGEAKLAALCRNVLEIEPDPFTCFLFVNRQHDTMVMYCACSDGAEVLLRKLTKGSFLVPAPEEQGRPYVILRPSMLPRLFRA